MLARLFRFRLAGLTAAVGMFFVLAIGARAQEDGGSASGDGGGQEVLESIFVPYVAHAPFSLTLATEWQRPISNGGTYTVVNSRPIRRDGAGRIYQERWLLSPKGSGIPSRMSWIQIADPVAHTYYECSPRQHVCEVETLNDNTALRLDPNRFKSGDLPDGKGTRTHEDLGAQTLAGVPVHEYRDTTTINPGVLGNDQPMSTIRHFRFSAELGLNLTSVVETPRLGKQTFTVTEISTTEPDARFFAPPEGYNVVDHRKPVQPKD
ncbi:hypothetical protein [Granulicella sibirica]|uniref:Uncharacterized protein n=1 Tax=Granulicella sibirica TaxID=2479048 RepID=A0A4Q0T1H4_9BACT|nr:hypothetical protein [Granulicella sibirica]RXH55818.1 hypothetical protein GRAN_2675 [Granulicella sibirica]